MCLLYNTYRVVKKFYNINQIIIIVIIEKITLHSSKDNSSFDMKKLR